MIQLENFEGHLVLYCKGWYSSKDVDFLTGVRRIWAVRCGFDVEHIDRSIDEYIANALYKTLKKVAPQKIEYLFEIMHKEVSKDYLDYYKNLTHIETLIKFYKDELSYIQVKEKHKWLVKLPKPQKRLFKRIVSGKGNYNDYKLVK